MAIRAASAPSFCANCGQPYPWTQARLDAARLLASEMENLDECERQTLSESLPNLIVDTPLTSLAAIRFRRVMNKLGPIAANSFREIIVSVMTEAAKRQVWGA